MAQDRGSWIGDLIPRRKLSHAGKDVYRHLDDGVAIFASDLASNIQIVFWNCLTRFPGKYRFRISAYAYQTDQPVLFHLNGGRENLGDPPYLIDYFEVPPGEPTVVEFVTEMEARRNIRLLVDTKIRPRDLERRWGRSELRRPRPGFAVARGGRSVTGILAATELSAVTRQSSTAACRWRK